MAKVVVVNHEELAKVFKYEDGKLWRLGAEGSGFVGQWREVNLSKANNNTGYVCVRFGEKSLLAHRIIYMLVHKVTLGSEDRIDHVDGDRLANTPDKLRLTDNRGNNQNTQHHRSGRLCGTYWHKIASKWQSSVRVPGGERRYLGLFPTEQEAHEAYLKACNELKKV